MAKKRIDIMVTAFRDGFQSVYGGRVLTRDFIPAVEAAVDAGLLHLEAGGGARFQSLYFYCNEDAFDMMDAFRRAAGPRANLQSLARGINVVGLDSQSSDIIRLHAKLFRKHGITTIRNFDALNDIDNLDFSGRCIVEEGLRHEICISMMGLPPGLDGAHTPAFYMKTLREILDAGIPFHSLCFKDASGTSTPRNVHETVRQARAMLPEGTTLVFHTHETAGTSIACYLAAIEAGADAIDLSIAPVSGGTCQPDVVALWQALRDSDYTLDLDIKKVLEAESVFKDCMKEYFLPPEARRVEPVIPFSPMPGGAYTANTQMMRDNNVLDRFPEVILAMEEVVARGGFGTSVTPVSQFYFQQAFDNVMFGPWKKIADGYGRMVLGYFGKTPVTPDPEIVRIASAQLGMEPTSRSPRLIDDEDPEKGIAAAEKMLGEAGIPVTDENVFIAATCGEKGIAFLKGKARENIRKIRAEKIRDYTVTIDKDIFSVTLDGNTAHVDGKQYSIGVKEGTERTRGTDKALSRLAEYKPGAGASASAGGPAIIPVPTPIPGIIIRIDVEKGDTVKYGDILAVVEVMKMETEIKSPANGVVQSIEVSQGDHLETGQVIMSLSG
jgi:pyruvate carboxylase subunit B